MSEKKIKILYTNNDQPPLFEELQPMIKNLLYEDKDLGYILSQLTKESIKLYLPSNNPNSWWYIADAEIRVSPIKGCDKISLKKPKLLYAEYKLFYDSFHLSNVIINYDFGNTLAIRNLKEIKYEIVTTFCFTCHKPINKCSHNPDKMWDQIVYSSNILYVDEIEPPPAQINLSKFSALLAGMAKTLRLKATHKLNALAEEIMTKNPEITEEQLASELFKRSNELSK
jgi:hypothetical protein